MSTLVRAAAEEISASIFGHRGVEIAEMTKNSNLPKPSGLAVRHTIDYPKSPSLERAMCCFAGPVKSVTDTNLFARLTSSGTQMLVYQMKFETEKENAMILPLPVTKQVREDSLRFVSLKEYDNFFDDLDDAFPDIQPQSRTTLGALVDSAVASEAPKLAVHEVGDFVASFVPTMNDFSRLDQKFVIPKSSWDKIPQYSDYGFAVFQLKSLKGKPHPMAFEFETRLENQIFFPTVHIHDGEVHKREHFDHTLYLQSEEYDDAVGRYVNRHVKDRQTGYVRSKDVARHYCNIKKTKGMVKPDQLLHRIQLKGRLENRDIIAKATAKKSFLRGLGFGHVAPLTPALLGVCGLGWLIDRRNKIRQSRS